MSRSYSKLLLWLGYLAFVIYGSLVPLQFTPKPLDAAWLEFLHIPFLQLGMESRADWVANGVLYVPVGFLTATLLSGIFGESGRWLAYFLAVALGCGLAIAVEFVQVFFPPRTVSLNDLLAEGIGTGLGVIFAAWLGGWIQSLLATLRLKSDWSEHLWKSYLAAYLAFALFPFDFLVSWSEIDFKVNSTSWGWWVAPADTSGFLFLLRLTIELMLTAPIGYALAVSGRRSGIGLIGAGCLGLLLGVAIELLQFFLASGTSQGVSVLTRSLGAMLGFVAWRRQSELMSYLRVMPGPLKWGVAVLYVAVLLASNGWFSSEWLSATDMSARLAEVHFLPFYYHYFTTEAKALYSLASVSLMYAPLGVLVWLGGGRRGFAVVLAVAMAVFVEAGKLFLAGKHPDPTNVLIAGVASGLAASLFQYLMKSAGGTKISPALALSASASTPTSPLATLGTNDVIREAHSSKRHSHQLNALPTSHPGPLAIGMAATALIFLGWQLANFPLAPISLGLVIAVAAVAVWYRPHWIFFIVPATLPVFDLAPWSGRFFLDEFDMLLLALIPLAYLRTSRRRFRRDMPLNLALGLLLVSFVTSTAIGIGWPRWPDANAFNNYYSPYNALRITRGFLWALLLIVLAGRLYRDGEGGREAVRLSFAWGMTIGLALTVAVVLWERVTFSSLFNFDTAYRATGPFSAIHNGGAYIECFLAAAVPFLVVLLLTQRNMLFRVMGIALLVSTTYALMVTYSRNGYSAYLAALGVVFIFALFARELRWQRFVLPVALGVLVLGAALPIFIGGFAQERMALIGRDLDIRKAHWLDSLTMRDDGVGTDLFGMGVGRFPETAFWNSQGQSRHASYRLEEEGGNVFLRLTPGESLYMEQFIPMEAQTAYVLRLDLRANTGSTSLNITICQKWMLASNECIGETFKVGDEVNTWLHHEGVINSGIVGGGSWYAPVPVKLSLHNGNANATVDVDNLSLEPVSGENILKNGDFAKQLDHWFFSTDNHLQWHAKNLPVGVFFDQGLLGLAAWSIFLGLALIRLYRDARRGDLQAAAIAGSIAGILVVGLFDTVIDTPRFLLLLILLAGIGALKSPRRSAS